MKAEWKPITIAECIEPMTTIDPTRTPDKMFTYIDVSAVSRETLSVQEVSRIVGSEAPSRARRLVKSGDVLFATIRPTLKRIAQINEELDGAVCSTGYFVLRPKADVFGRFLFYVLQSEAFGKEMEALQRGAAYPAVSDNDVKSHSFLLPSVPEQKRIVALLDEAFTGLDAAIANTTKNLANGRELFDSYLNAAFSTNETEWSQKTVSQLVEEGVLDRPIDGNHGEIHPKKADFVEHGIPFVMASDLSEGDVDQTSCNFISKEHADSLRKGFSVNGDVLISHKGTIGRCAV